MCELLASPNCFDDKGNLCLIITKDSNVTDLTVGCYVSLEAYTCNELDVKPLKLTIYNYNEDSGPFSAKGDSGSLIFDSKDHMVGILHSGMLKGKGNHVTYVTPAW